MVNNKKRGIRIVVGVVVVVAWMVLYAVWLNQSQAVPTNMLSPRPVATNGI
jgi:hypothetical protein